MAFCRRLEMDIVINGTCKIPSLCEEKGAERRVKTLVSHGNYYVNLLACLGYSPDSPPVADLLCKLHGLDGAWLIVSPLHWQATHNDAMIVACDETLQLSDDESRQWFKVLADYLAQDHIKLHYHDAYTWLIQSDERSSLTSKPVSALLQHSQTPHLKALGSNLFWQRFITEAQMLFSSHFLNHSRKNQYPINGVWVWGEGKLHSTTTRPIVCGEALAYDLASILSTQVSLYEPGQSFAKETLFLLSEISDQTDFDSIGEIKRKVCWYWNDIAYVSKPKHWLKRFWRNIRDY